MLVTDVDSKSIETLIHTHIVDVGKKALIPLIKTDVAG